MTRRMHAASGSARLEAARPAHGEARRDQRRLPREARHAGRARRAHRAAGAARSRRWSAPIRRKAERAAALAKADLATEMVGEFPELQGLMGRYYALAQGEDAVGRRGDRGPLQAASAPPTACRPTRWRSPSRSPTSSTLLVGFWAIDEKPTGSKDPYALRRAALGVIRIVLENGLRLPLDRIARAASACVEQRLHRDGVDGFRGAAARRLPASSRSMGRDVASARQRRTKSPSYEPLAIDVHATSSPSSPTA